MREIIFQSTLSVRRATGLADVSGDVVDISIHALRKESDGSNLKGYLRTSEFQSTLSVRRATFTGCAMMPAHCISIHALRKESDLFRLRAFLPSGNFNPRSP